MNVRNLKEAAKPLIKRALMKKSNIYAKRSCF